MSLAALNFTLPHALQQSLQDLGLNPVVLIAGAAIVLGGLGIFGVSDLARFRFRRVWAISDVCFAESIRRRVLWLVPLAVVGLIAIVQLQQPLDALDSIRQTTKYCLLTTGLVVVTSTLILACTNLPREIENKVIFTVVTKPTTRLEIVLGKVVGFSRLSGTILLLMGVFSFGYLHLRAWLLERDLKTRLDNDGVEKISRPTFQHYVNDHLLSAKELGQPADVGIFAKVPDYRTSRRYPVPGGTVLVKFELPPNMSAMADPDGSKNGLQVGMAIDVDLGFDPLPPKPVDRNGLTQQPPEVTIEVRDPNHSMAIGREINGGRPFTIEDRNGKKTIRALIPTPYVANLAKYPFIYVALTPSIGNHLIWIDDDPKSPPVRLVASVDVGPKQSQLQTIGPQVDPLDNDRDITEYLGRDGQTGQQVAGDTSVDGPVAVYDFRNTPIDSGADGKVPFEFRIGVEKSGESNDQDVATEASLRFVNPKSGFKSDPVEILPENNRVSYGVAPAQAFADGNFKVEVHCKSPGQWLNVTQRSLSIVKSVDSFGFNLLKADFILWMLSILVITISVCCSTFLSWPVAVVLTLVVLLGRWTLDELGDAATAGIGRTISGEFGFTDPSVAQTVSESVERLNSAIKIVAVVLPDISKFPTTDDIEQGVSIPMTSILGGMGMMLAFGVPLTVMAYIFLKHKEVAP